MTHYPRATSRTPAILELHRQGFSTREIAARVGCSQSNVTYVIRNQASATRVIIDGLSTELIQWLQREAKDKSVTVGNIARSLMIDAILDAQEQEARPKRRPSKSIQTDNFILSR